jgi:hypothetical protein
LIFPLGVNYFDVSFELTSCNHILQEAKPVRKNSTIQNFFNATPISLRFIDG